MTCSSRIIRHKHPLEEIRMFQEATRLVEQVIAGEPPSPAQGLAILTARGATLTAYLAGAHHLRERAFGNRVALCSIINAKSGRCSENCAFCAQSAHYHTSAPAYPLKSREEIVAGAILAQAEGSHCYGIVTSGSRIEPGGNWKQSSQPSGRSGQVVRSTPRLPWESLMSRLPGGWPRPVASPTTTTWRRPAPSSPESVPPTITKRMSPPCGWPSRRA